VVDGDLRRAPRRLFLCNQPREAVHGPAPVGVNWQLHATSNGYKVTDLIINRISMANAQRDDLISVIQHNGGQVQALLVALREKNASNGIIQ
jgi:ABC-type transporter MlaC component